jgi:tetratricopeptide (TPR) repeat protein
MKSRGGPLSGSSGLIPVPWTVAAFAALSASIVTLWGYGDTCHYDFVFDDYPGIVSNAALKRFVDFGFSGFGDLLAFSGERILTFLSFAWSWKWIGSDPCSFRIVNLALHTATSVLVGASAVALHDVCGGRVLARREALLMLAATCIFAAHPVQTQAVTYIYQRLTVIAAFFSVLAFLAALRWMVSGKSSFRVIAIVALSLALMSKPNSAMVPFMILVTAWRLKPERLRGCLMFFPPLLIVPVLMQLARGSVAGRIAEHGTSGLGWSDYFLTQGSVIWKYVGVVFWPPAQSVDHVVEIARVPWSPGGLIGIAGWLLITVIVVFAIRNGLNRIATPSTRMLSFGVVWFFAMLMVESSVIPIRDVMMEHRVYLPFAGFAWISGPIVLSISGQPWFSTRRWLMGATALLIVTVLSSLTEIRNRVWETPETLWRSALVTDPSSPRARLNLGNALLRNGRFEEALGFYDSLSRSGSLQADAIYHRGLALAMLGRFEDATRAAEDLIREFPVEQSRRDYLLAWMALVQGDFTAAHVGFSSLESRVGETGSFLRQVRMGKVRAATRLAKVPGSDPAVKSDWFIRATSGLEQVLAADPADMEARVRMVRLLGSAGRVREAEQVARTAPGFMDQSGSAWLSLAMAEIKEDPLNPEAALGAYREAMRAYPQHKGLQIWYGSFLATLGDNDRIHQIIGGTGEIDDLADHAIAESAKLLGALQPDEAVNILRRVLALCESGARKCSRQAVLLQSLGKAMMVADPESRIEAESLITRGRALDPGGPGTAPAP